MPNRRAISRWDSREPAAMDDASAAADSASAATGGVTVTEAGTVVVTAPARAISISNS